MIYIDELWKAYLRGCNIRNVNPAEFTFVDSADRKFWNNPDNFFMSWGENVYQTRHASVETGFFRNSLHIDTIGLYERCSLNFPEVQRLIEKYDAPVSLADLNAEKPLLSKFPQNTETQKWDGIVVICQHPTDRSIWRAGSTGDYHNFLHEVGKHYGKSVLFKKHPVTLHNKEEQEILSHIASKYGCELQDVDISVIDDCEAVFVYNSTFVIDALLRNRHVYQYAPGYFWQSGVVQYTGRKIPTKMTFLDTHYAAKFLEFLIWKYCFPEDIELKKLEEIIRIFSKSKELFPLPEEFSYGNYWLNR